MSSKIQLRRDTAANWTSTNPVLSQGEPGLETDTSKVKYGDGSTAWNLLDYASGGSSGAGDYSTGFTDGINDNTYHFIRVQGKKEFTYQTEGYKIFEVTLTAPMVADMGSNNLTFTGTDTPEIATVWLEWTRENSVNIYKKSEYDVGNYSNYINTFGHPDTDSYVFSMTDSGFALGDIIVIKYWTEGSTYVGSNYDVNDPFVPDVSETTATNTVTISYNEFTWWGSGSGSTFESLLDPTKVSKHYLTFLQSGNNDRRNITNVVDNQDGTVTLTFDGTAVQSLAPSAVTFSFTALDSRSNDYGFSVPMSASTTFATEAVQNGLWSNTYKYTGGTQRSGYLTINGSGPLNFWWYQNTVDDQTWYLNMFDQVSYNSGDTIEVTYYKAPTTLQIGVYTSNPNTWNNGYKWFDWKDDLPEEYSPGKGNGIMAGLAQVLFQEYRAPIGAWEARADSWATNFGWVSMGSNDQNPYDPYNQDDVTNWGNSPNDVYPMYDFDENGIIAYSSQTYYQGQLSMTYKMRIIYRFDLTIGEDDYDWFNC